MTRISKAEWRVIMQALDMVAAGPWDEASFGARPDFETILDKVAERTPEPSVEAPPPVRVSKPTISQADIDAAAEAVRLRRAKETP